MQTIQTVQATAERFSAFSWFLIEPDAAVGAVVLGAYNSRSEARAAKATEKLGKVVSKSEVEFQVIEIPTEAKQGDAVANAVEAPAVKTLLPNAAEILKNLGCPYCGDTSNGCTYDDEPGHETEYLFCHVCSTSFHQVTGVLRRASKKIEMTRFSTIERPCKQVWHIADEMAAAANGFKNLRRKDVLARCVASGIAFYTARTQYQLWLTIQNGGTI